MTEDSGRALTATEVVIADLAARGNGDAEIAHDLDLTTAVVERNLSQIYRKLGIRSGPSSRSEVLRRKSTQRRKPKQSLPRRRPDHEQEKTS